MEKIKTLSQFIDEVGQLPEEQYVFRGVSNIDYQIEASTYRRLKDKNGKFINEGDHTAERLLQLNQEMIDDANIHRHGWINEQPLSDLNLLADLQHKGAATCLIDFTKNPLVALWMACRESSKGSTDGKVYVIDVSSHLEYKPVSVEESMSKETKIEKYFETDQKTGYQLYQWQPNYQNSRMRAQQSIFLFGGGAEGITESGQFIIDNDSKDCIRKSLKKCASITGDILFPDIEGFATHRADSKNYYADDIPNIPLSEAYLGKARKAASEGKEDQAINFLNYGLANEPTEKIKKELYKERAITYYNKEDLEKTIFDCTELISLGTGDLTSTDNFAFILRGKAQYNLGQYLRAIASFDTAIQINPKDKEANYWRGMANIECYEYEQAITDFDNAIEIDKEDLKLYHWRGVAKYHVGKYDDAIEDFTFAIELNIRDLPTHYYRGMANYEKAEYRDALYDYRNAIYRTPNDPFAYHERGQVNKKLNRRNDAKSDFQLALFYAEKNNNTSLMKKINSELEEINSELEEINSELEEINS